jgi:hypothetical protein
LPVTKKVPWVELSWRSGSTWQASSRSRLRTNSDENSPINMKPSM